MAEQKSPLENLMIMSQRLDQLDGQFDWSDEIQKIREALSHAEGEAPFAWHRGGRAHEMLFADDLDGALVNLSDGWEPLFKRLAPQVAVPEGYALVPVEPTHEMIEAGKKEADWYEHNAIDCYQAMLAAAPTAPAAQQPVSDPDRAPERPLGAAHNGRVLAGRVEQEYGFECQGGPISGCYEWQELRRCLDAMAEYVEHAPDGREIAARALDEFRTGPLRSACLSYGWDTESDAYIVDRMLDEEASLLRAGKEGE